MDGVCTYIQQREAKLKAERREVVVALPRGRYLDSNGTMVDLLSEPGDWIERTEVERAIVAAGGKIA